MKTLTQDELRNMLLGLTGCEPVTISSLTEVEAPGYGKPIMKLSRVNGLTGADYSRAMNRLVPFVPKPRQWGHRISPHMVEHTKDGVVKYYLTLKVERSLAHVYLARHGSLLKTIEEREINQFLRERDDRPITVRDYYLGNIKRISIAGQRYRIVENS